LDLKPLAQTPLIIREGREDATDKMLKAIKSRGLTPNIVLRCASPAAVKAAVRRKMGVGILFHNLIEEEIKRKDLKTLKFSGLPKLMDNSYIVYRKNKALPCAANDFLTLLRSMKTHLQNPVNSSETNED
jgi:DNA-binding transcriptional LysR family regulator